MIEETWNLKCGDTPELVEVSGPPHTRHEVWYQFDTGYRQPISTTYAGLFGLPFKSKVLNNAVLRRRVDSLRDADRKAVQCAKKNQPKEKPMSKAKIIRLTECLWEVESSKNPGIFYQVRQLPDGQWICTCPDFMYREKFQCKHIDAVHQAVRSNDYEDRRSAKFKISGSMEKPFSEKGVHRVSVVMHDENGRDIFYRSFQASDVYSLSIYKRRTMAPILRIERD